MVTRTEKAVLVSLLLAVLILTGAITSTTPVPSMARSLAPIAMLGLMGWYLMFLVLNRRLVVDSLAAFLMGHWRNQQSNTKFWQSVLTCAVLIVAMFALAYSGLPESLKLNSLGFLPFGSTGSVGQPPIGTIPSALSPSQFVSYAVFLAVAIYAVSLFLIISAVVLALRHRIPPPAATVDETREQAEQVLRRAVNELKGTGDYHEIILECYVRMCNILANHGMVIGSAETAREFADKASKELQLGADAVNGLTFLFEEARYSGHNMTDEQRGVAVTYLGTLQNAFSPGVRVGA